MNNQLNESVIWKGLDHYWSKIDSDINKQQLHAEEIEGYILLISEYWEYLEDNDKWLSNVWKLIIELRNNLSNEIYYTGIIGGLVGKLFCINSLSKKTKLFNDINVGLAEVTQAVIKKNIMYYNINNLQPGYYDFISGVSGIGIVLIYLKKENKYIKFDTDLIYDIEKYLVSITLSESGFMIKRENQLRETDYVEFAKGSIDFGAAHGMIGPLLFLSAAYSRGYIVKDILLAIKKIIDIYMCYVNEDEHKILQWPSQMGYDDFEKFNFHKDIRNHRMSWCYGSLGISFNLYNVGVYMNQSWLINFSLNNLIKIANLNSEYYLFDSPILCHGYSGALLIFQLLYKKTGNIIFNKKANEMLKFIEKFYNADSLYGFYLIRNADNSIQKKDDIGMESFDILSGVSGIYFSIASLLHDDYILNNFL